MRRIMHMYRNLYIYNTNQDPMSICKYFNDLNKLFASTVRLKELRFFIYADRFCISRKWIII